MTDSKGESNLVTVLDEVFHSGSDLDMFVVIIFVFSCKYACGRQNKNEN